MTRRRYKKGYLILILGVLFLGMIGWGLIKFGKIRRIECACPQFYVARVNYLLDKSWYFLPNRQQLAQALASYVEISEASLSRKFPEVVVLHLTFRQSAAIVNGLLVDAGGHALAPASNSGLLQLSIDKPLHPGETVDTYTQQAILALSQIHSLLPEIQNASQSGAILQFTVLGTTDVVLDLDAMLPDWPDSLQLILTRAKMDGKLPRRVDLRFNNPIMVY